MRHLKGTLIFLVIISFVFTLSVSAEAAAEEAEIIAEEPLVVTTCGQSPGSLMAQQLAKREGIAVERHDLLQVEYLIEKHEAGEGFNTLMITIGTSGKGLGAAGIDMNDEEERINALIEEAKNQGMVIIGGQIEGEERRVDSGDERSMEIVAPQVDILIVHVGANKDNYYTDLAEEKGLPIYYIEGTMETAEPLKQIFGLE